MSTNTSIKTVFTPRVILQLLIFIVLTPLLPLIITWNWGWWEAWAFALTFILGFIISRLLVWRRNPDLIAERGKFLQHDNPESWDKTLAPLVGLGGGLIPIVAGLDARFGPSVSFDLWVRLLGLGLLLVGMWFGSYALLENSYFSGMVRIQKESGQKVIDTGPYGWVRHPGYAGALVSYLGAPFLLESLWTLIPVGLLLVLLVVRTALEDRTLQEKLEGYSEYAQRVRYRLIPGVW